MCTYINVLFFCLAVFIALDTPAAKSLRRQVDLKGYKILLWDTKSFWPTLKATIPNQSKAVNHHPTDEDMWTYLKNSNAGSGESSLSTQSTDTMLVASSRLMTSKRASTLRNPGGGGHFSTMAVNQHPQPLPFQTMQSRNVRRPNVVENPLEEPIYHTLDDNDTVYINADLEVVYPSHEATLEEDEAELNGLLADCGNYESDVMAHHHNLSHRVGMAAAYEGEYVPSPAPGSMPRPPRYSSQLRTQQPSKVSTNRRPNNATGQGYLV